MQAGDFAESKRIFTAEDVLSFGKLVGDMNPMHFDPEYTAKTIFKKPIVHGPFVITLVTSIFANTLPGPGTVYLSHNIRFVAPVYIGDEITAKVEVSEITEKGHCILNTVCTNQDGVVVIEGSARTKKM